MRGRVLRIIQVIALGCCFQFAGCQSRQIADIIANSFKGAIVDIGTIILESVLDNAIPME